MLNVTKLICLTKIKCEILCNLPQKYRTNDFTSICVQHMKYSLEARKNEDGAKIVMVKKSPSCNNVQLNKVQLFIRDVV